MSTIRKADLRHICVLLLLTACGGTEPTTIPTVETVAVILPANEIRVGQTIGASATVRDQNGAVMQGQGVAWETTDDRVANINAAG